MENLLISVATGQPVSDNTIALELAEVCINVHTDCDYRCPVFILNKGVVPVDNNSRCQCFLDGVRMLAFIRKNVGEVAALPIIPKKKKKAVVPVEHIERFARFKQHVAAELHKQGVDKEARIFTMRNPLTPTQFVKIVEDYDINNFPNRRKELMSVVTDFQNSTKTYTSASQTIRKWLNIRLKVDSFEDLTKLTQFGAAGKVIVPSKTTVNIPSFMDEIKNKNHE